MILSNRGTFKGHRSINQSIGSLLRMLAHISVQERLEKFPQICRQAGLKVTPQRMAVFSMLAGTKSHPSPEEVYSVIRETSPSISLATVYKILDLFQIQGFIRRVSTQDQVTRYDANIDRHNHFLCSKCGGIQDVMSNGSGSEAVRLPDSSDFQVTNYEIQFYGLCHNCRK